MNILDIPDMKMESFGIFDCKFINFSEYSVKWNSQQINEFFNHWIFTKFSMISTEFSNLIPCYENFKLMICLKVDVSDKQPPCQRKWYKY